MGNEYWIMGYKTAFCSVNGNLSISGNILQDSGIQTDHSLLKYTWWSNKMVSDPDYRGTFVIIGTPLTWAKTENVPIV